MFFEVYHRFILFNSQKWKLAVQVRQNLSIVKAASNPVRLRQNANGNGLTHKLKGLSQGPEEDTVLH